MKLRLLSTAWLLTVAIALFAQGPNKTGKYYRPANGKMGEELKTAMFNIIKDPGVVSYSGLKEAYIKTDTREDGYLRDFYSDITSYVPGSDMASGQYEGFNYNREHTVCQSWFGSESPMMSDVIQVIPTDGYINSRRNNNPFGWVDVTNTEKLKQSQTGYSIWGAPRADLGQPTEVKTVFEPNIEVKGDIARIYMYMATCYQDKATTFTGGTGQYVFNAEGTTYQPLQQWVFDLMMEWSKLDPVDDVERARNNAAKEVQGNRNPFVDYPGLEDYIWGSKKDVAFSYDYYEGEKQGDDSGDPDEEGEPIANGTYVTLNNTFFNIDWTGSRPTGSGAPTQLTGKVGNVTILYAKGTSGQTMYCNASQIRLYKYNTLTFRITGDEFTKIEFDVAANPNNKTLSASNGDIDGYVWTGATDEVKFQLSDTGAGNIQVSGVKLYVLEGTGISAFHSCKFASDDRIYNIMGVQMDENQLVPGIYIKNGKKFMKK